MGSKHEVIRSLLTDAIVDLCRREAFYVEELRIEGTLCIVSDRSSVLVTQITEQIGDKVVDGDRSLPLLEYNRDTVKMRDEKSENDVPSKEGLAARATEGMGGVGEGLSGGAEVSTQSYLKQKEQEREQQRRDLMVMLPSERTNGKYKCPFCPKVYGFKHNLKDHINKHTGRKPHICKYCGMNFTFLASLCGHIKRRHFHCMPREHQCHICGNRFPNKQSLRQHFTWRHSPHKTRARSKPGSSMVSASPRLPPVSPRLPSALHVVSPRQRKNSSPRQKDPEMSRNVKFDTEGEPIFTYTADVINEQTSDDVLMPKLQKEVVDYEESRSDYRKDSSQTNQKDSSRKDKRVKSSHGNPQKDMSQNDAGNYSSQSEQRNESSMEEMDLSQALGLSHPGGQMNESGLLLHPPPAGIIGMPLPLFQASSMGFPMFPPSLPLFTMPSTTPTVPPPPPPPKPTEKLPPSQIVPELFRSPNGKFNCPYCEKSYRFKHTLKDHINTHFGKRPHVCKYCSDAFTHFASLCAHIKRRHKDHIPKDFACAICNENFMNLQSLKQHFTWRHKDVKLPPGVPMFFGPGTGRKLNSGPDNPPRSSPTSSTSSTTPLSAGQSPSRPLTSPGRPLASPGQQLQSPGHPLASPSQLQPPNNLLLPSSPNLPSMQAFMKGGGLPPGLAQPPGISMLPEPVKDMMGLISLEAHHQGAALFSPLSFFSPQGSVAPPGVNRENYN